MGFEDYTDMLQVKRPQSIPFPQKENIGKKKLHAKTKRNNIEYKTQKHKEAYDNNQALDQHRNN